VTSGTVVDVQVADNTPIADVDLQDSFISAPIRTLAGQQGVAIQLIDQSPIAFDELIFADLAADYTMKLDKQVLSGTGINGQELGVTMTPGITTIIPVTTPDLQHDYGAIANAVQTVHTTRFLPPTVIAMHPRRWGWFLSLLASAQLPLYLPGANGPSNVAGVLTAVDSQEVVGQMHGLPVVTDPNIPTTVSSGTGVGDQDVSFVMRASDLVLYESGQRMRSLPEVKAPSLTLVLQLFGYLCFSAARHPASVVELTGPGLAAPTF
jgi:HK97 family phage major capsid protein